MCSLATNKKTQHKKTSLLQHQRHLAVFKSFCAVCPYIIRAFLSYYGVSRLAVFTTTHTETKCDKGNCASMCCLSVFFVSFQASQAIISGQRHPRKMMLPSPSVHPVCLRAHQALKLKRWPSRAPCLVHAPVVHDGESLEVYIRVFVSYFCR